MYEGRVAVEFDASDPEAARKATELAADEMLGQMVRELRPLIVGALRADKMPLVDARVIPCAGPEQAEKVSRFLRTSAGIVLRHLGFCEKGSAK